MAAAIFFGTIYTFISRWFYAQKDTRTPLAVSIFAILLNIALGYTLTQPSAYGIAGLALAPSIVAFSEVVLLVSIMLYPDHKLFDAHFISGLRRIISATGSSMVTDKI